MRILIVDDSQVNRKLLEATLQAEGLLVVSAEDGREALGVLEGEEVDAVISDVLMPNMDGYRLCHEIRNSEKLRDIPIILYSATYTSASDEATALEFGADKFLKKPARSGEIFSALQEVGAKPRKPGSGGNRSVAALEILQPYSEQLVEKLEQTNLELEDAKERLTSANRELGERSRQLNASLMEKEVLLREIHHRVKNNLQIISSLLDLQSGFVSDQAVLSVFRDIQSRVEAMGLVHEHLYGSKDLAVVDFGEYVRALASELFMAYGADDDAITLSIDVESVFLPIDSATPCGLIINELVSNSLKHAFPDRRSGSISIALQQTADQVLKLDVSDDGVGCRTGCAGDSSMGLQLVHTLVDQMSGEIEIHSNQDTGTHSKITLKPVTYKQRI